MHTTQSGTIELRSGRWHWTILAQWTGSTVVYQHRERAHDEMRNWVQEAALTSNQAVELGLEPLERTWLDADGLKWRLSLELPLGWRNLARRAGTGEDTMSLVFKRGGVRRGTEVPADTKLGELTHQELRALLEETYRSNAYAAI